MDDWTNLIELIKIAPSIAIFYFLWNAGIIQFRNKKGEEKTFSTNGNGNGISKLSGQMATLTQHFNHETTELLTEIRDNTRGMKDVSKDVSEIKNKVLEFDKYGVKSRQRRSDDIENI